MRKNTKYSKKEIYVQPYVSKRNSRIDNATSGAGIDMYTDKERFFVEEIPFSEANIDSVLVNGIHKSDEVEILDVSFSYDARLDIDDKKDNTHSWHRNNTIMQITAKLEETHDLIQESKDGHQALYRHKFLPNKVLIIKCNQVDSIVDATD